MIILGHRVRYKASLDKKSNLLFILSIDNDNFTIHCQRMRVFASDDTKEPHYTMFHYNCFGEALCNYYMFLSGSLLAHLY